jgi:hypothetical protein
MSDDTLRTQFDEIEKTLQDALEAEQSDSWLWALRDVQKMIELIRKQVLK